MLIGLGRCGWIWRQFRQREREREAMRKIKGGRSWGGRQ